MKILNLIFFFTLVGFSTFGIAENKPVTFDYYQINESKNNKFYFSGNHTSEIFYFFSLSCPACQESEPFYQFIKENVINEVKTTKHERIPVAFNEGWDITAKMYFILKNIKKEELLPVLFEDFKNKKIIIPKTDHEMYLIIRKYIEISFEDFESILNSKKLKYQMDISKKIEENFNIEATPMYGVIREGKMYVFFNNGTPSVFVDGLYNLIK